MRIQCERTQILNMRALTFLGQSRHGANTVPSDWAVIMFSDILDTLCNMSIRHSRRRQLVGGRARNSSCSPFICLLRAFVFSVSNTTCDIISEDREKIIRLFFRKKTLILITQDLEFHCFTFRSMLFKYITKV